MSTGGIHKKAAAGFSQAVEAYERGRPGYSEAALSFVQHQIEAARERGPDHHPDLKSRVLDLAAGTGKFTEILFHQGLWDLVAVEPIEEMRAKLEAKLPDVPSFAATAERLPFLDGSFDAVTVAQAFHWFDYKPAVLEISRVLRPGGLLILVWNLREEAGNDWVSKLSAVLDRYEGGVPRFKSMLWKNGFDQLPPRFLEVAQQGFPFEQVGDLELMRDRVASISFIAALGIAEHEKAMADMDAVFQSAMGADGMIRMPYRTHVFVYQSI